jgi:hypothetical protein
VVTIVARGIPNCCYGLERGAEILTSSTEWEHVCRGTACANGQIIFTDTNPPPACFYRTRYP